MQHSRLYGRPKYLWKSILFLIINSVDPLDLIVRRYASKILEV